jgi:hypothetical protein
MKNVAVRRRRYCCGNEHSWNTQLDYTAEAQGYYLQSDSIKHISVRDIGTRVRPTAVLCEAFFNMFQSFAAGCLRAKTAKAATT